MDFPLNLQKMRRTKIICTIGPAVSSYEKIVELIESGMNVARLNFSHGTYADHLDIIEKLKRARKETQVSLAIMLDTKGPKIRLGSIEGGIVKLEKDQIWSLTQDIVKGDQNEATIVPGFIINEIPVGSRVLFDDGYIAGEVVDKTNKDLKVKILNAGSLKSGKSVNLPFTRLSLSSPTEKDIQDIHFGCDHDVEFIAASFVRSAEDIVAIKKILAERGKPEIQVIAKIENHEGITNFDSIVQIADGIMIARGDLGVEVPLMQVPKLQKMMIRKCSHAGKPSVTATQMLESMIKNPRPTRAEASDIANAIYDSTSAVMLSGETATGEYPIECVKMMKSIVEESEGDFDYKGFFNQYAAKAYNDVPSAVTLATVKTAYSCSATAIFAFTNAGSTARLLSRLRPEIPILGLTPLEKCFHQLSLYWGVIPVLYDKGRNFFESFSYLSDFALKHEIVKNGDLVLATVGTPFGVSGTTNTMMVDSIGFVLVRGKQGTGKRTHGKILLVPTAEGISSYTVRDRIIVITKCDASYLPLIHNAQAVLLQNLEEDLASEEFLLKEAESKGKPALIKADNAFNILHDGQLVTLDTENGIVYKGVVL
ncbi:pyruvate kinase [Criblamydia sequanensis]|uniref:Pyruvate kinase n=1 Tax=Candidatus Criblamydia sequanensis CRIB-18 TaxID=1437425 RepID=A0A090CYZ7_9BACT|nr:pyruvate kinase [Criblamydia sequanensis]CDR33871.1 Pyruvate kinase [Criblamydia sequanensis CRIB-18]